MKPLRHVAFDVLGHHVERLLPDGVHRRGAAPAAAVGAGQQGRSLTTGVHGATS